MSKLKGPRLVERSELTPEQLEDLVIATRARLEAYAPYMVYYVGAAIRTRDNHLYCGWNTQYLTYTGAHAEMNAVSRIPRASREAGIKRVTVVGGRGLSPNARGTITRPCGHCAQDLSEFIDPKDLEVISAGLRGPVEIGTLADILKSPFRPGILQALRGRNK